MRECRSLVSTHRTSAWSREAVRPSMNWNRDSKLHIRFVSACDVAHVSFADDGADPGAVERSVADVVRNEPQVPFVSNLTGDWIRPEHATDPAYWARHLRGAVRFADGLRTLSKPGTPAADSVLLEIGPGAMLASLAQRHPNWQTGHRVVSSIRSFNDRQSDTAHLLAAAGNLWLAGVPLDAGGFYAGQQRRRLPLPTYAFQRQRFWIDPPTKTDPTPKPILPALPQQRNDVTDWFYIPSWKRSFAAQNVSSREPEHCLVFGNGLGLAALWLSDSWQRVGR